MSTRSITLLAATVIAFASAIASAQVPVAAGLVESDLQVLRDAASTFRKQQCAGARGITTEDGQRLIDLGLAGEMKQRFLANLSPWSAEHARFERLDPARAEDVSAMYGILHADSGHPGTPLDVRVFSAQVMLVAHYDALAAGCESPPALQALLPRLRVDGWAPLKVGAHDLADVRRDLDQAWTCFWKAVPVADANSPDAIRAYVATNGNLDELRADAYEFAVNLQAPEDRNKAGLYMAGAPTKGTATYETQYLMGMFLGEVARWSTFGDRVRAAALGSHHMAQATPSCRLSEQTLSLVGKRQRR